MMYKNILCSLAAGWLSAFSGAILAGEDNCGIDPSKANLKIVSCVGFDEVSVLKLMPVDQLAYETNLGNLPTFVVSGKSVDSVIKVVGEGGLSYNHLIFLPYPDKIIRYVDAATSARSEMAKSGWNIVNMKVIVYERQDGEEGPGVVCGTFSKKIAESYMVVSQCNAYYQSDISALKKLLELVGG